MWYLHIEMHEQTLMPQQQKSVSAEIAPLFTGKNNAKRAKQNGLNDFAEEAYLKIMKTANEMA